MNTGARRFVTDFLPSSGAASSSRLADVGAGPELDTCDALLVLNYTLPHYTPHLWQHTKRHFCADGGANRLYDEFPEMFDLATRSFEKIREAHIPEVIVGDLDSVRPEILEYYLERGTMVQDKGYDQDTTDLHKAIMSMVTTMTDATVEVGDREGGACGIRQVAGGAGSGGRIIAVGALGGRLDHQFANISVLHEFQDLNIVLVGKSSLAMLIPAGKTVIVPNRDAEGPTCGLIPFEGPTVATTSGLKWNLEATEMRFGGLLSTSNQVVADEVTVETDRPLLWTTELGPKLRDATPSAL